MLILDGKKYAESQLERQRHKIQELISQGLTPVLEIISETKSNPYINSIVAACDKLGIPTVIRVVSWDVQNVLDAAKTASKAAYNTAIIITRPFPPGFNPDGLVDIQKDVDGMCTRTMYVPAVVRGSLQMLKYYGVDLHDHEETTLIIGKGAVGRAFCDAISFETGIRPLVAGRTAAIPELIKYATLVISCTGAAGAFNLSDIQWGGILVDTGSPIGDFKMNCETDGYTYTPVPGGVGPACTSALIDNIITATCLQSERRMRHE